MVPYNPYLSKKYKCHINVEYCATIRAVKYLYKYGCKGHDRAALALAVPSGEERVVDEIEEHLDARYVGPPEAVWRLLEFPMAERSHHVERLDVHLPKEHRVVFGPGAEREALSRLGAGAGASELPPGLAALGGCADPAAQFEALALAELGDETVCLLAKHLVQEDASHRFCAAFARHVLLPRVAALQHQPWPRRATPTSIR